jgi:hypothetical protein
MDRQRAKQCDERVTGNQRQASEHQWSLRSLPWCPPIHIHGKKNSCKPHA